MSTDEHLQVENIQARLKSTFAEYQQQHRYEQLEEIGKQMERTLMKQALANALFKQTVTIDSEAIEEVNKVKRFVQRDEITKLDDEEIDSLEQTISTQERHLDKTIQECRMEKLESVQAFSQLNEELEFMNQGRLNALVQLLDNWEWEAMVDADADSTLDDRIDEAVEIGELMADVYKDAQQALGEEFSGTQIQEIIDQLLNEDSLPIGELDIQEVQALSDSKVGPYLELSLTDKK